MKPFTLEARGNLGRWIVQNTFDHFEDARAAFKRVRTITHHIDPFLPVRIVEENPEGATRPRVRLSTVATGSVLGARG